MKKKLVKILLVCFVSVTCMCGCEAKEQEDVHPEIKIQELQDTTSPSYIINTYIVDFKKQISIDFINELPLYSYQKDALDELPTDIINRLIDMLSDFDFQIINQSIEGDKAIVNVSFATYDFVGTIKKGIISITKDSIIDSITNSGKSFDEVIYENVYKIVDRLENSKKNKTFKTSFPLNYIDGEWVNDSTTSTQLMLDSVSGGLLSSLSEIEELLDKFE